MLRIPRRLRLVLTENPYQYMLTASWRYAVGMRGRYLLVYAMFVVVNLVVSVQPVIWGYYVNFLQTTEGDVLRGTLYYVLVYLALIFVWWAFQWPARLLERRLAFDISERLLLESYDKIISLPLPWHRDHHSGDTINRARKAYEALKGFFDNGFAYFQTLARMLFAVAAIIYFNPLFGLVAGVFGFLILFTVLAFDEPIIATNRETNERENDLLAGLNDNLSNIITVITLRLGRRTATAVQKRIRAIWAPFERNTRINEFKWFSVGVETGLMYAILVFGYVYQNYQTGEVFLVGGLVTLVGYIQQFVGTLNNLTAQYNQVIKYRADMAAVDPIYTAAAAVPAPRGATPLMTDWQTLSVTDLHFSYGTEGKGLHDVSLVLPRGGRIALIGPSGSGKTTLLYTLRGVYPASTFNARFDDSPAEPASVYEQTTLITQSPEIFEATLQHNLTMGLERTPSELRAVAETSALNTVIDQLEGGMDTFLTEGGVNLSGGQRQRISIARGLLAADTSNLLLLDEPTSSLDPETELLVYQRLFAAYPEKTIVSTLHRLHLLRYFDHIYFLDEGRVIAHGTLPELLEQNTAFRRLYERSFSSV